MIEFALPYIVGIALGMTPSDPGGTAAAVAPAPEAAPAREPEPQVATGKFTTAVEVKPILGMTKSNWVAVRLYEGQDLVYFTHLLSWRCGLWEVRYGLNGAPATEVVPMEPCHEDMATPNALTEVDNFLPYVVLPPETVTSIYVEIHYDDGTTDFARFDRGDVLIP